MELFSSKSPKKNTCFGLSSLNWSLHLYFFPSDGQLCRKSSANRNFSLVPHHDTNVLESSHGTSGRGKVEFDVSRELELVLKQKQKGNRKGHSRRKKTGKYVEEKEKRNTDYHVEYNRTDSEESKILFNSR